MNLALPPLNPDERKAFFQRRAAHCLVLYRFLGRGGLVLIMTYSILEYVVASPDWFRNFLMRGLGVALLSWHSSRLTPNPDDRQLDYHICRHILLMATVVSLVVSGTPQGFFLGMPGLNQLLLLGSLLLVNSRRVPWLLTSVVIISLALWLDGTSTGVWLVQTASLLLGLLMSWLASTLNEASARREFLLERRLEREATTDPLTGLLNRRSMIHQAQEEVSRVQRYSQPLSLMVLDLDYFKSLNDTYGHDLGDQALVQSAQAFTQGIRSTDRLARWGGEEFLLLLPATSQPDAMVLGERLRQKIEQLRLRTESGEIAWTVSIGVAQLQNGQGFDQLLSCADQALYSAKHQGRNRVLAAGN